jgi:hypothetical protein
MWFVQRNKPAPLRASPARLAIISPRCSLEKAEVVANCDHLTKLKFSPATPCAFTEHGALMVASVLNSKRAIEVSIYIVRAFVKVREVLGTHIRSLFDAIRQLMEPPPSKSRRIGFKT